MYKKHSLIASILLIIPLFTTAMEVEEEEGQKTQQQIYIQTSDGATVVFYRDSSLFSQSTFFIPMLKGKFQKKGTADNPIILKSVDSKQLLLIHEFIIRKTDPERLKQYLQNRNINDLTQLIVIGDFLDVKGLFESIAPYFIKQLQDLDINALNELIMKKAFINVNGVLELIVPYLVKQLQNPNVLNAWLQVVGNKLLAENETLSDHMKHNIANKIRPTPQYLQKKKSIPSDVLKIQGNITSLVFSSDLTMFAYVLRNSSNIIMWDVKKNTKLHTLTGHNGNVLAIAFNPNSTILASGAKDKTIKFWNVGTGEEIRTFTVDEDYVYSVAFNSDGTMLASGSKSESESESKIERVIRLWDIKIGKTSKKHTFIEHFPNPNISFDPMSIAFSFELVTFNPNYTTLAFVLYDYDSVIGLLNLETNAIRRIHTGDKIKSLIFNPNGTMLASVSRKTRLWDMATDKHMRILTENKDSVLSVAFSQDSNMLASGSYSGTIRLYDAVTGEKIRTLTGHKKDPVNSVTFNQTGTILASVSTDGTIRLWHLIDLEEIKKLSTLELLLIHAWQHAGIINLQTYQELNTIYNQASGLVKKLIKTLTSQPEKTFWQRLLP